MAQEEIIKVIKVQTGGSETTVKGLKEEINNLRDALLNAEKGSEEYKAILEQLIDDQKRLTDAMRAGQQEAHAAEGSYNALVNQMAALKKVWRETTDEVSRKEIGKQIKDINDKLSNLDESIGDFRRKVGSYSQSITDAFGSMGGAASGVIGPLNGIKKGFQAISSHPIIGVVTLLASLLINGLVKGFESSEEATNKLKVAMSAFKPITDALLTAFQGLAKAIGDVALAFVNLLQKWGVLGEKSKERMKLQEKEIELEKKERDMISKTADLQKDAAELREKASDEENYTIEERIKFLQDANDKEKKALEIEREITQEKLNQYSAITEINDSTSEEYKKREEYKAKLSNLDKQISAQQAASNKEINKLRKKGLQEAVAARTEYLNLQKDLIKQEYDNAEEGSEKQLELAKQLATKELEIQQEGFKTKIKNRSDYNKAMQLSIQAYNQSIEVLEVNAVNGIIARERELSNRRLNLLRSNSVEYYEELKKTEEKVHNLYRTIIEANGDLSKVQEMGLFEGFSEKFVSSLSDKNLEAFKTLESESLRSLKDISDNLTRAEEEQVKLINQIILNGTLPMSKYYETQITQLKDFLDELLPLQDESDEAFIARQNEVRKQIYDAEVNHYNALLDEYQTEQELKSLYQKNGLLTEKDILRQRIDLNSETFNKILELVKNYVSENEDLVATNLEITKEKVKSYVTDMKEDIIPLFVDLVNQGKLPTEIMDAYISFLRSKAEAEKDVLEYRKKNWMDLGKGIGSIVGSIADLNEELLNQQVKNGEKSQKQAEEEFENTIKPMRIAEAVVNTIAGSIAAFMGYQELGQPWGAILGAIQATAVAAAGAAQIAKISNTKFGSASGADAGGSVQMATVTPVMLDYQPQATANVTGQQETEEMVNAVISKADFYVRVSDIDEAQQNGRVRVSESTF